MRGKIIVLCLTSFLFPLSAFATGKENYDRAILWRNFVESDTRLKIGVALGGGGARGMAHVGVLRSLEAAGIPIDMMAGTSIGSFVGALYCTGAPIDDIEKLALQTNWSNLIELKMSRIGFFSTRRLERFINFHLSFLQRDILRLPSKRAAEEYLESDLGDLHFKDLKIPFACLAADLYSGSLIIFDSGPVAQAVRASCSIPGLFEPITLDDRVLVDGGVLLNLPVSLCKNLGAEYVIAIDLESDTSSSITGLVDVLAQIIKIQGNSITAGERELADHLIQPAVGRIKTTDLNRANEAVREGEIAGARQANAIKDDILGRLYATAAQRDTSPGVHIPPLQSSTSYGEARADLIPTAMATLNAGLNQEALQIISRMPARSRNEESVFIETLALIRLRRGDEASTAFSRLETAQAFEADLYWTLAAAAIDVKLDTLADSIVAHIAERER